MVYMEDIKAARKLFFICSLSVLFFFGGWASFVDSFSIGNFGLKITAIYILPYLLIGLWLYSWYSFYVLSRQSNKPIIDALVLERINSTNFIFKAFPHNEYGLSGAVAIGKWGWPDERIPRNSAPNFVFYGRVTLKRHFMFNYFGSDLNGDALYVHFGDSAPNIKNGCLTPFSKGYWNCLWFEFKFLLTKLFDTPTIGSHYIPHFVSWAVLAFLLVKAFLVLLNKFL